MKTRFDQPRREFMALAGIGLFSILGGPKSEGAEIAEAPFTPFNKDTQMDIGGKGSKIIEAAYQWGFEYEKKHGGCCRCTVAALQNALEFVPKNEAVFRAATCLDGGATPSEIQNCGAFTGSGIVIGYLCGTAAFGNTSLAHKIIRAVYEKFRQTYGSVLCKDVRQKGQGNCPEVVGKASRWTAEALLTQFTNYRAEVMEE